MNKLTDLNIPLSPNDSASVSFLLLQTHLSTFSSPSTDAIDRILWELYQQYYQMQQETI